jgi:ABC-type dipeptide/oligopeptide/nickel transport system permease component
MLEGVNNNDYPVVRSTVLILVIFTAIAMLITDLMYAFIDPRIKAQYTNGSR